MKISSEEINHIALLSRLALSPTELEREREELSQILAVFENLQAIDTIGVEPTDHVLPIVNVLREDTPRPSLTTKAALQNAPEQADNMFQVPRVVEAE